MKGKLLKSLRDPVWQFIGAILALVAIVFPFIVSLQDKPIFDLQIVVLANTSLVKVVEEYAKGIEITYNGRSTDSLTLLEIKLENTGNQPILPDDYERPIKFVFPKGTEILEASVRESIPDNILMELHSKENEVTISETLLNPQERVQIRFLLVNLSLTANEQPFIIDARIANLNRVTVINALDQSQTQISWMNRSWWMMSSFLGIVLLLIWLWRFPRSPQTGQATKILVAYSRKLEILINESIRQPTRKSLSFPGSTPPIGCLQLESNLNDVSFPKIIHFTKQQDLRIGRDQYLCDVVLRHKSISKLHASLVPSDQGVWILDRDSTAGTYVNGKQLGESWFELHHHDLIEFGPVTYQLIMYHENQAIEKIVDFVPQAA